ncbi:MAG TPA: acetate kinase [Candidatus Cloacimonetes bacterium]|nr:acetate kinase [Candidatus Cloacimonadota bacterium]
MKVLVINCGSSSVKYQFINLETENVLADGIAERIGEDISLFTFKSKNFTRKKEKILIENHEKAIQIIIKALLDRENGVIQDKFEIEAVGHRLVHAGEHYSGSVVINEHVVQIMRECVALAPLHNPANIKGIEAMNSVLPKIPQCGVFDTAFHQTMPSKAYLYALPYKFYTKDKIRRYGFHGTSHKYVSRFAAEYLQKDIKALKIITCHIGNGASITAIEGGKSVDTSMGFTPLEGLMMGTRCGDIDPAIPIYLMKEKGMGPDLVNIILNKKSGMIGLSEISNDMREIEDEIIKNKNPKAIQAHEVYAYKIKKYIGSYTAVMNGLDILVFTGGVGENMPILRELVCDNLDYLGIKLDKKENNQFKAGILELQAKESKVKVLKIPTNEELMIALETQRLLQKT